MNSKTELALPLRKEVAFGPELPMGARLFNVRDGNNNAVACQLEEYEADAVIEACNTHTALQSRCEALRAGLEDAAHRVRWLMQFVGPSDVDPIEAELARWSALLEQRT